jgi:uncharacterized membrane protein
MDAPTRLSRDTTRLNMHPADRAVSGMLGALLCAAGARRGGGPGVLLALGGVGMLYRSVTGHCPAYAALGMATTSAGGPERPGARDDAATIERWVTVGVSPTSLDALLRRPGAIGEMMGHFAQVRVEGDVMHWRLPLPLGRALEWEARIVERSGERLTWLSEPGAALRSEGSLALREAPAGRGTVVSLQLAYSPPGGTLGNAAMKLAKVVPEAIALRALQRLKSLAEAGEIATSAHDPSGRGAPARRLAPRAAPRLTGSAA